MPIASVCRPLRALASRACRPPARTAASLPPGSTSADADEINRFARLSRQWWDPQGPFAELHRMNPARLEFVRSCVEKHTASSRRHTDEFSGSSDASGDAAAWPLRGLQVLDVGCGGGFLSEALARMKANVTGIDASEECIAVAKEHKKTFEAAERLQWGKLDYEVGTSELHRRSGKAYDIVCALEIIEHVVDPNAFLKDCMSLVCKENGLLFVSTINRSLLAGLLTLTVAERIMKIVPEGTHTYEKYIRPKELESMALESGAIVTDLMGMTYIPCGNPRWKLTERPVNDSLLVNYIACIQPLKG